MVRQGPYGLLTPCLIRFPIGSSFGQYLCARLRLTTATGGESGVSDLAKYRPASRGILSVSNKPSVTGTIPAFGTSPRDSQKLSGMPSIMNVFHQFDPRIGGE